MSCDSAGINALNGHHAHQISMYYAKHYGIDMSKHRAKQLNRELLCENDLILVMDYTQLEYITRNYKFTKGRVFLLGHWENKKTIYDPINKDRIFHKTMVEEVYKSVQCWKNKL